MLGYMRYEYANGLTFTLKKEEAVFFHMLVTIYQITCRTTKEGIVIKVRVELSLCTL